MSDLKGQLQGKATHKGLKHDVLVSTCYVMQRYNVTLRSAGVTLIQCSKTT